MSEYDCTQDVKAHQALVEYWLRAFRHSLERRAINHDNSKLENPDEKAMFDTWVPKLQQTDYGTPQYQEALENMGEGLRLHYRANRHHPEHFPNGINDMTIMDVVEMLADWMAVAQSKMVHVDLKRAQERFGLSDQLVRIFANTLREEDFWSKTQNAPLPDFCPPEYQDGHIEVIT